ncbi:PP2C family protein-serine/threonine phosphatase [Lentibacter sp.]|uniref:PP2C family protein-serine/threonine phosphatase n=1 Tax=Lentibacter sp. TaxID=2024994 RepID=UPI003F694E42
MQSRRRTIETGEIESNLVLVVDDSRLQRSILRASLKKWGYRVAEVSSGDEALAFCENKQPDLVISDWMMPGMDGIEFCRRFKALDTERFGYFILLTSKSDKSEIAQGLDAGADDFLTKPVSSAELRARLVAGERILNMERELIRKNELVESTLGELKLLYDKIDNDLIEAKQLQQSLVRERYKDFGTASISLMLQSSGHVGGDLVGYFPINEQEIGLFAIDVSGHGISSALMTARLAGYMSAASKEQNIAIEKGPDGAFFPIAPSEVIARLNNLVQSEMTTEHYFTLVYATLHLKTGKVIASQAGHPHPLVQRQNGEVEAVGAGGLPVGLVPDAHYEQFDICLNAGDRLIIFSDGVPECMSESGAFFEDESLVSFMKNWKAKRGPSLLDGLLFELDSFAGDRDFSDDISAILLEFQGGSV